MSLLDLLKKGSILTDVDGGEPTKMDLSSKFEEDLTLSQLDLDGKTPKKYLDNKPV